jgi:hypothetical protein
MWIAGVVVLAVVVLVIYIVLRHGL